MEKEIVIRLKLPSVTKRQRSLAVVGALVLGGTAVLYAAVPSSFNPGDPLSSAKLNDNFGSLQSQITTPDLGARVPSGFHASLTTATTTGTGGAAVLFDRVDFDIGGEYNNVTGAFVVKNAGIYLATCDLYFTAGGIAGTYELQLKRNGSPLSFAAAQSATSTGDAGSVVASTVATVKLAAGDTVTCIGGLAGGTAPLDINNPARNTFSAIRVY